MSGSRRSVPRPEHGASTSTQSNVAGERQAAAQTSACTTRTFVAPLAATVRVSSAIALVADIARDDRAASAMRRAIAVVLPPATRTCRGHAGRAAGPASSATSCDASSCTTNQPSAAASLLQRASFRHDERVRRPASRRRRRHRRDRGGRSTTSVVVFSRLARSVSFGGWLLNCIHARRARSRGGRYHRAASHRGCDSVVER